MQLILSILLKKKYFSLVETEIINNIMYDYFHDTYFWYNDNIILVNLNLFQYIYKDFHKLCSNLNRNITGNIKINILKFAVADGIYTSIITVKNASNKITVILNQYKRIEFIKHLSIFKIIFIPYKTRKKLFDIGIKKIRDIETVDLFMINNVIKDKQLTKILYNFSDGHDISYHDIFSQKQIVLYTEFQPYSINRKHIAAKISFETEKLFDKLKQRNIFPTKLNMKIYFEDNKIYNIERYIKTNTEKNSKELFILLKNIFLSHYDRRCGIKKIIFTLYNFIPMSMQYRLFQKNKISVLDKSIIKLRRKYGSNIIKYARSIDNCYTVIPNLIRNI